MSVRLEPVKSVEGTLEVPGDKSVSHRSLIFGAISNGTTEITHLLQSEDVRSTASCLVKLGVEISQRGDRTIVAGRGLRGLRESKETLDCGNSGTTIRTMMGLLAGQTFSTTLTGDASIQRRPMRRVAEPLAKMGAQIELTRGDFAPLTVRGVPLVGVDYELKIASAQVKTALLLAGIYAEGKTRLTGAIGSRDHTERMLPYFGVPLEQSDGVIGITGGQELRAAPVRVPGDPSSAAFWLAAATLVKNSSIEIRNVSLNPTRTGFIEVLRRMGASIVTEVTTREPEPLGTVLIRNSPLRGVSVEPGIVPAMIDEIPLLAVVASQAEGTTIVHGAEELRVKESDRIEAVVTNLRAMGVQIEVFRDGYAITGPQPLQGAVVDSFDDHRIAMSFAIASLVARGTTEILKPECVAISYPGFFESLGKIGRA